MGRRLALRKPGSACEDVAMCTNYRIPPAELFPIFFDAYAPTFDYPPEAWPLYEAPILVRDGEATRPAVRRASFGLRPPWARDPKFARKTYNARSETVAELASYRKPWRLRQFCLVPTTGFFEPSYESGKAERWLIRRVDGDPFALAGIWETRREESGLVSWSFSMLTINATDHPLMQRFHAPEDEKRSVVVVAPADHARWLAAREEDEARAMLRAFDATDFTAEHAPKPPRKARG